MTFCTLTLQDLIDGTAGFALDVSCADSDTSYKNRKASVCRRG